MNPRPYKRESTTINHKPQTANPKPYTQPQVYCMSAVDLKDLGLSYALCTPPP